MKGTSGSLGQLMSSYCRGRKFKFKVCHITFMESDHEIISAVILFLLLIPQGQLSVTDESMCSSTG